MRLGGGADARADFFQSGGSLAGTSMILRCAPADALRMVTDAFASQGFEAHGVDLAAALRERSSEWEGVALHIGDRKKSWARGLIADLAEETPLSLLPAFRRGITPLLLTAAARRIPTGETELRVALHTSKLGDPDSRHAGARRAKDGMRELSRLATEHNLLIAEARLPKQETDSPVSGQAATMMLKWQ